MDSTDVLTALRNELEAAGIVRDPNTAGDLPPLFIEPEAAPAPGERDAPEDDALLTVSADLDVTIAAGPFLAGRPRIVIRLRYRSRTTIGLIRARRLDAAIVARILDRPDGGLGWVMDEDGDHPVLVLESSSYAGLSKIGVTEDGVTDQVARYVFEVLAG